MVHFARTSAPSGQVLWKSGLLAQIGFGENALKKSLMVAAAIAAITPLFVSAGAAQAATTFTPELVYAFDTSGDTSFEPDYIASFGSKVAIELDNGDMWVSDGTAAGTVDMSAALAAAGLVVAGDNLFFGVTDESLGEMALYKIAGSSSSPQLANTGADLRGIALGALGAMALVALGGALVIARRRTAQV